MLLSCASIALLEVVVAIEALELLTVLAAGTAATAERYLTGLGMRLCILYPIASLCIGKTMVEREEDGKIVRTWM